MQGFFIIISVLFCRCRLFRLRLLRLRRCLLCRLFRLRLRRCLLCRSRRWRWLRYNLLLFAKTEDRGMFANYKFIVPYSAAVCCPASIDYFPFLCFDLLKRNDSVLREHYGIIVFSQAANTVAKHNESNNSYRYGYYPFAYTGVFEFVKHLVASLLQVVRTNDILSHIRIYAYYLSKFSISSTVFSNWSITALTGSEVLISAPAALRSSIG